MMKKILTLLALMAVGVGADAQSLSGKFTKMDVSGVYEVILTHADECSVEVVCTDTRLEGHLKMKIKDDKLILAVKKESKKSKKHGLIAYVSMPRLSSVELSGVSSLTSDELFECETFGCEISGASSLKLGVECLRLDVDVSGVSSARLWGSAQRASLEASGMSSIDCREMKIDGASVDASGISKISSSIDHLTDVDVSGISKFKNRL